MGEALDTAQPVVEYLPGWHCDITAARKWRTCPSRPAIMWNTWKRLWAARSPISRWAQSARPTSTAAELPQKAAPEFQKRKRHRCLISLPTAPAPDAGHRQAACIEVVPFYVSLDGEHYRKEGLEIPVRDFYQFMVDNPAAYPKTSLAPSRTLKRPSAHTPRRVGRYCVWCSPAR